MQSTKHQNLVDFIWNIANKLRGPYRPPQYRRVMLPRIVLRRFDLVLAENKQKVLDEKKRLEDKGITGPALEKVLSRIAAADSKQELFNTSGFTFHTHECRDHRFYRISISANCLAGKFFDYCQSH